MGGVNYGDWGVCVVCVRKMGSSGRSLNVIILLTVSISIPGNDRKNAPLSNVAVLETFKVTKRYSSKEWGSFEDTHTNIYIYKYIESG